MITLPPEIDAGMYPRSAADEADERVVLAGVHEAVARPGRYATQPQILGVILSTGTAEDEALDWKGRALSSQIPVGSEGHVDMLRAFGSMLGDTLAVELDVNVMLALIGPSSTVDKIEASGSWGSGDRVLPNELSAQHRVVVGPRVGVAVLAEQVACMLRARWGIEDRPEALAHVLNVSAVFMGSTEIAGSPLWGDRILLTQAVPPASIRRWNGSIQGATVEQGWWATVRRRSHNGSKVVTVGRYETPMETDLRVAVIITHVKGAP